MTYLAGRPCPFVSLASPGWQPPSPWHSSISPGPAARRIAPDTDPPPSNDSSAGLTIASTERVVTSAWTILIIPVIAALFTDLKHQHSRRPGRNPTYPPCE